MNPLALIPSWVWAAAVASLAATSCKLKIDLGSVQLELEKTKVVYEQERAHQATVLAEAQGRAREAEQTLTQTVATVKEETHAQVLAVNAVADRLRERLRDAQARVPTIAAYVPRSTAAAADSEAPPDPPGAVFLATLGEQDVDEAQRADTIRVELLSCYRQYDAARAALAAMRPTDAAQETGNRQRAE